ncbi:Neutral endopeptidase [compost metagenome]
MSRSKLSVLCLSVLLSASASPAAPKKKPSSEIPAKREFPLNKKVNACEDFHKYVCSDVESSFKLRDDRSIHTFAFNDSSERLLETKKEFMKSLADQKDLDPRTVQVQDFYLSCMDTKGRSLQEKKLVERTIAEVDAFTSPLEMVALTNQQMGRRFGSVMGLFASANVDDPLKMDATVMSDIMLLPDHDYYDKADIVKAETELLTEFFKTIFPKISVKDAKARAENLMTMQKDFVKIYPRPAIQRQRWSEKRTMSQKDFAAKFPKLQPNVLLGFMPSKAQVNVPLPEGLQFLNDNLEKYSLQTWKDYLLVDALMDKLDEGYPAFYKKNFDMNKKYFGGPVKRSEIQERCTNLASRYFTREIDAALIDKVFPNFDEKKVNEVAEKIRQSIIAGLQKNTWLSSDAKKGAIEKIKKARLQLVKPHNDREWDFTPMRTYFANDYIQNVRTYMDARWEKNMKELREPANQDAWGMGPLTVNAYYNPSENKFVMPVGILQFPFYDANGTIIENLGAVGAVVGHELGHSIDDQGSRYDAQGRLKPWMSTKDIMEFNLRGQRMMDQFTKVGFDGKLTLGENVADLVGLTFAYHAAFPDGKGSKEDKQKFFVSYGRVWCSVVRPDFETLLKKTDPHAAGWARINEQVKHQPAFAEAFSCKPGDKMVLPENERIHIW